ncbi:MAG: DUF4426 domain-containing protein [Parahaliea sp.]
MKKYFKCCLFSLVLLITALPVNAQRSERFGAYELHYNVVNSTFLSPEVAAAYGIVRAEDQAFINLALRKHGDDSHVTIHPMTLKGSASDLMQRKQMLEFQLIEEGEAIYYIAPFHFLNREWLVFDIQFQPEGSDEHHQFKYKYQLYKN